MINKTILLNNIKNIFEAITPEEIKQVAVFRDSMEIFCEVLDELSKTSIDISSVWNEPYFKEEFFKTYNGVLYETLNDLQTNGRFFDQNQEFREIYQQDLLNLGIIKEPSEFVTGEEGILFRKFFEDKGLKSSIEFAYDWVGSHSSERATDFRVQEIAPFHIDVEGTISKVVYDYFVRAIQHPMGFQYAYSKLLDINLDKWGEQEYYYNQNNQYQITPELIDGTSSVHSDNWYKNNNNIHLKSFSSNDFPGFIQFHEPFELEYSKLEFIIQEHDSYEFKILDFLYKLDSNGDKVLVNGEPLPVKVVNYRVNDLPMEYTQTWSFADGSKAVYIETHLYFQKSLYYYDQNDNLIFKFGDNEVITFDPENMEFEIQDPHTSVLDYLYTTENKFLEDIAERSQQDADLPDCKIDVMYPNPRDNINIAFDGCMHFIEFHSLSDRHKPLRFDFVDRDTLVQKETPYNNNVLEADTLQSGSFNNRLDSWDDQYFDLDQPLRDTKNFDRVFQQSDPQNKFFFSPLTYDPWQEFDETIGKPNYGYWTTEKHKWKFIGQEPDENDITTLTVGTPGLKIHRGVRMYYNIPGFQKIEPLQSSPHYSKQSDNLEDERPYWQPIGGVFQPIIGEVESKIGDTISDRYQLYFGLNQGDSGNVDAQQYNIFLDYKHSGRLGTTQPEPRFIRIDENDTGHHTLKISTFNGSIGYECKTPMSIITRDSSTLIQKPNGNGNAHCETFFYLKDSRTIIAHDSSESIKDEDWDQGDVYWFELPKQRSTKNSSDRHTFYRGISPRQEEYNYMHFKVIRGEPYDPVNMQYRTLEAFEIDLIEE